MAVKRRHDNTWLTLSCKISKSIKHKRQGCGMHEIEGELN